MINAQEHHKNQPNVKGAFFGDVKGVFRLIFEDAEIFSDNLFARASDESTGVGFGELGRTKSETGGERR
jgi:hypothetical protein